MPEGDASADGEGCYAVDETCGRCGRPIKAMGLCQMHYARKGRSGSVVLDGNPRKRLTTEQTRPIMILNGFMPLSEYPGNARTPWPAVCLVETCGRESSPTYDNVRRRGHCCKWCSKRAIDPEEASQVMRNAGLEPLTPYPGRNSTPWPCACHACHETVTPCYASIAYNGAGCNACGNRRAADKKRTPERAAVAVMRAAGFDPLEPFQDAKTPWRSRCLDPACGKESSPTLSRVKGGSGCGYCKGTRRDVQEAVVAMLQAGLEPLEPYPGSGSPWLVRCKECLFERPAYLDNIRQGIGICPSCADYGIDYSAPGHVYVVTDFEIVKLGIVNDHRLAARISEHRAQGLDHFVYSLAFDVTQDAKALEDRWKVFVKERRVGEEWEVPRERLGKYGGHTEAAQLTGHSCQVLRSLLPDLPEVALAPLE